MARSSTVMRRSLWATCRSARIRCRCGLWYQSAPTNWVDQWGSGRLLAPERPLARLRPVIHGGGHERGLRSGSLNVPGIVGFGEAAAIAVKERVRESIRLAALRDRLDRRS